MSEPALEFLFHPKSVAFIGVSGDPARRTPARTYLQDYIESGFPGNLYPVGPGGGEISGQKIYKSLKDIPGNVDYAVVAIPAKFTSGLLDECASKNVKALHLFTAGFTETGSDEGRMMELEMLAKARRLGIRILGPNCMGVYCPETRMTFSRSFPNQKAFTMDSGTFGFIAQSGGNSIHCVTEAIKRKVLFSKAISYGNGTDVNECDFLEYFTDDPDTGMIGAYIEGIKGGKRFIEVLKKAASKKPVIIYKAGLSEGGSRTAASHTASLSGSREIWNSLLKQSGAVQVHSIEEIVDMALLFLKMPPPKGRNIGLVGSGGGPSVHAADECYNAGLVMPQLSSENRRRLQQLAETDAGYILGNPTDVLTRSELMTEAAKIVADDVNLDALILHVAFDTWSGIAVEEITNPAVDAILKLKGGINKPVTVALICQARDESKILASAAQDKLLDAGFPVFPSVERAATAIRRYIDYGQYHQ